jgi:hypothetical protein
MEIIKNIKDKIGTFKKILDKYIGYLKKVITYIYTFVNTSKQNLAKKRGLIYEMIKNTYLKSYGRLQRIYITLKEKYKKLPDTNPYKKTTKTLQRILQKLEILHEKTLVTTIVKLIFLFRKYKK